MPNTRSPRKGTMQFWPRVRAKKGYARVNSFAYEKEPKLLGFAGYKAGMSHLLIEDNRKTSTTKGEDIFCPVTIIECPPIKIYSVRFYKNNQLKTEVVNPNLNKELIRKVIISKKKADINKIKLEDYDDLKLIVYTQPRLIKLKKKPEIFELAVGGILEDKFKFAKENLDKEILLENVFQEGQQVDIHSITKGKGFQGPVKRFGVAIRQHKSEKTKRGPGSLGGWKGQGHVMYRVAHAGQMGYHKRTEYNKRIIRISNDPKEINPKDGFVNYGTVKTSFVLVKGSIPGHKKRLIIFTKATRPNKKIPGEAPSISYVSLKSKQG